MIYICACTNNSVELIGPFAEYGAAKVYGDEHFEDPRWNVVELAIPVVPVTAPV